MTSLYQRILDGEFNAPHKPMPPMPDVSKIDSKRESQEAMDRWENDKHHIRLENQKAAHKAREAFWKELAEDEGLVGHPKLEILQSLAWDQGHSSGLGDVYNAYVEMAVLLR